MKKIIFRDKKNKKQLLFVREEKQCGRTLMDDLFLTTI